MKESLRDRMRILFFAIVPNAKGYGMLPLLELATALFTLPAVAFDMEFVEVCVQQFVKSLL